MNGKLSSSSGIVGQPRRAASRESGPTTATVAHCSVTDVSQTRSSGHSVCSHSSIQASTARRVAGRRRADEALLADAHHDAVVEDHPVGLAHHAVAARADGERVERVRVDAVQELDRVGALDVDLAERRSRPSSPTRSRAARALAQHGLVHRLAVAREVARPLPLADVLEHRAVRDVPRVDRRRRGPGRRARRGCGRRAARTRPGRTAGGTSSCRARRGGRRAARRRRGSRSRSRSCPGRSRCRSSCSA